MSYILDALKKIEHEKNKKVRPDGRTSISGDLFKESKQPSARAGIWNIVLLIVAASLVTCVGTWLVLRGNSRNVAILTPSSPPAPVKPQSLPSVAPVAVQPLSTPVAVPSVVSKDAEGGADDGGGRRSQNKQIKVQLPPPKQSAQTVPVPSDIKLSGIAWQDERKSRRAVVNGFLLKEGAVVSGAKITDIMADRVRFSSAAGVFEVKLDAVLPAEVQR